MPTLTVTAKGQVTLRKDLLRHLGVEVGDRLELRPLPGGRVELRAARPAGTLDAFVGRLADKTLKRATLEEIEAAAAEGWAAER
jgi:antitoxin PrlF